MGDDDARAVESVDILSHYALRDIVERTCRLVHEEDGGVGNQGACDEEALLLSATESLVALAHDGVHLHGHLAYVVGNACHLCRPPCVVDGAVGGSDGDVAEDVAGKEAAALQTGAYHAAQTGLVAFGEVVVVVEHSSRLWMLESQEQTEQGALAASRRSHNRHIFAGIDLEIEMAEEPVAVVVIAEREVAHLDAAAEILHLGRVGGEFGRGVEYRFGYLDKRTYLGDVGDDIDDGSEGGGNHAVGHTEGDEVGHADVGLDGIPPNDGETARLTQGDECRHDFHPHRGIVGDVSAMAIEVEPLGEDSFLRPRELDLLYAGKHVILHSVEHRLVFGKFALLVVHLYGIHHKQCQLDEEQDE